jgi:hypothetical protein
VLLVLGLFCAVLAAGIWAVTSTLTDQRTILNEADAIAKSEPVREEFTTQIAASITPQSAVSSPTAINLSNDLGRKVVETPAFTQAFAAALPAVYARVIEGQPGDIVLDPVLVNQAFADAGTSAPNGLTLRLTQDQLPDLGGTIDLLHTATMVLGILAVFCIAFGVALSPHRSRAIMRIGRWLITTGIVTIIVFWALPTLALLPLGGWVGVIGIVLSTADWLVVPASVLTAFGIAIVVVGRAGEAEARRNELSVIPTVPGRSPKRASIS